jgi:hypothetical protein
LRERLGVIGILDGIVRSRNSWYIGAARELAACRFRAKRFHGFGAGADEGDACLRACAGQCRVFRKKAVARMDGVATGAARDMDYFFNAKIALARGRGPDGIGLIGEPDVQRFAVDFAENSDAANAQLAAGAQDAHGNFAAIGNQDFPEHGPLDAPVF